MGIFTRSQTRTTNGAPILGSTHGQTHTNQHNHNHTSGRVNVGAGPGTHVRNGNVISDHETIHTGANPTHGHASMAAATGKMEAKVGRALHNHGMMAKGETKIAKAENERLAATNLREADRLERMVR